MMGSAASALFSISLSLSLFFLRRSLYTTATLTDIVPVISQNCFMFPQYKQSLGCCFVHLLCLSLSFVNSGRDQNTVSD